MEKEAVLVALYRYKFSSFFFGGGGEPLENPQNFSSFFIAFNGKGGSTIYTEIYWNI